MMTTHKAREYLEKTFQQDAKVFDAKKGYVSVPSVNLRMDPQMLLAASMLIADHFDGKKIQIIHGIPHSGSYLATAVALQMPHVRLHTARKDQSIPAAWKEVYRREVRSFTQSTGGVDVYSGITLSFVRKGDHVLLVDDVCARGETGISLIEGLQERGVVVEGYAVLFDKVFQGGLERIQELGVDVFSCVHVDEIGEDDHVRIRVDER